LQEVRLLTRDYITDILSIFALVTLIAMTGIIGFGFLLILMPFVIAGVIIDSMIKKEYK
jgi:hypothetical protein